MRFPVKKLLYFTLALVLWACTPKTGQKTAQTPPDEQKTELSGQKEEKLVKAENAAENDGIIDVIFLQMNDVYEIAPLQGGKVGGLARVASLYQQLKDENPNTLFVLSGDFLSPSLLGTLKYQGQRIKGRQMVETLNAAGVQVVTFGNHEFDLKEKELQDRINESSFMWVSSNVRHLVGGKPVPFYKEDLDEKRQLPAAFIWEVKDADGTVANIGIFGVTLASNPKDWVYYLDPFQAAQQAVDQLKPVANVVVGLTHLEMVQDLKLAGMLPDVPLLMGGHDHDHMIDSVGHVVVAKADANAKTVYVHRLRINTHTGETQLQSELVPITPAIPEEPAVKEVVDTWMRIQDEIIGQVIPDPYAVVYHASEPLDGRESSIRNRQTNMGAVITAAMEASAKKPVACAIFNSGGVRIDDQLSGDILAIDWFRTLPFGGQLWEVDIRGSLLKKVLDLGLENKGTGGYLQWHGVKPAGQGAWLIDGQPLEESKTYHIILNDFLLSGYETRLDFFTPEHPDILAVDKPKDSSDLRYDIRKAVIAYLSENR